MAGEAIMVAMDGIDEQGEMTGGGASTSGTPVQGGAKASQTPVQGGAGSIEESRRSEASGLVVPAGNDMSSLEAMPGDNDVQGYEVEAFAQLLAEQAKDDQLLLGYLADQLGSAWPEAVQVKKSGLLSRGTVAEVVVILEEEQFSISKQHGRLVPTVAKVMGGIAIRHDTLTVGEWTQRLAERLSREAERSEEARQALLRLVT